MVGFTRDRVGAVVMVVVAVSVAAAQADTIFVDDDAPPGGDGLSWKTSFRFLQDALNEAADNATITEIHVAQGTYKPDQDEAGNVTPGDRTATFQLADGVSVIGGYAGIGAADPDTHDPSALPTVLSGLLADDPAGNTYHVVTSTGGAEQKAGRAPTLDGFFITGGNADGSGFPLGFGGGMFNHGGAVTVARCVFVTNSATWGAGMYNLDAPALITDCSFLLNTATMGAALYNDESDATVTRCTFANNTTTSNFDGGAMLNRLCNPVVTSCLFLDNTSNSFGGGMHNAAASPVVMKCAFIGNLALGHAHGGGGIFNSGNSHPVIAACEFTGNIGALGGGVRSFTNSSPVIVGCTFSENLAFGQNGGGGLVLRGDALVIGCTFVGNFGDNGGAVLVSGDAAPTLVGCLIVGNTALNGAGLYSKDQSTPGIICCTLADNEAVLGSGTFHTDFSAPLIANSVVRASVGGAVVQVRAAVATVLFSNVEGGIDGLGNIDADPQFVDPNNGDYRLSPGSPCIDAGNNWGVPPDTADLDGDGDTRELTPWDLDGNPRFNADPADFDPGCGVPVVVDMGAYEFQFDPVDEVFLGDLDGDGIVGIVDFLALLAGWGQCEPGCCLADLDIDGSVGITDFLLLLGNWG